MNNETKHAESSENVTNRNDSKQSDDTQIDLSHYPIRKRLFAEEYLTDHCGTQAAIRAGYSVSRASVTASELLADPLIKAYIAAYMKDKVTEIRMSRERVLSEMEKMVTSDVNEIVQYVRCNCRYCWGKDFMYQRTPAEMVRDREEHERDRALMLKKGVEIGEFNERGGIGFDRTRDPNALCPECRGEGIGDVHIKDTRYLSPRARALYAGAERGKNGIKVNIRSRDKAIEMMARHHKLYDDTSQATFNSATPAELDAIYEAKMKESRERSAKVSGRSARLAKMAGNACS